MTGQCKMCNGGGEITRPKRRASRKIIRRWRDLEGNLRESEVEVVTLLGGTDACLKCTREAETEWRFRDEDKGTAPGGAQ